MLWNEKNLRNTPLSVRVSRAFFEFSQNPTRVSLTRQKHGNVFSVFAFSFVENSATKKIYFDFFRLFCNSLSSNV